MVFVVVGDDDRTLEALVRHGVYNLRWSRQRRMHWWSTWTDQWRCDALFTAFLSTFILSQTTFYVCFLVEKHWLSNSSHCLILFWTALSQKTKRNEKSSISIEWWPSSDTIDLFSQNTFLDDEQVPCLTTAELCSFCIRYRACPCTSFLLWFTRSAVSVRRLWFRPNQIAKWRDAMINRGYLTQMRREIMQKSDLQTDFQLTNWILD